MTTPRWVRPLRITTPEGDTIHGAQWPDGRVFLWPAPYEALAEAWISPEAFTADMETRGWTVEWAEATP